MRMYRKCLSFCFAAAVLTSVSSGFAGQATSYLCHYSGTVKPVLDGKLDGDPSWAPIEESSRFSLTIFRRSLVKSPSSLV